MATWDSSLAFYVLFFCKLENSGAGAVLDRASFVKEIHDLSDPTMVK